MPTIADRVVEYARLQIGDPYVWGAEGPNGFDCSGLIYAAYKAAGLNVSRTVARELGKQGTAVPLAQARPGDVVYFDNPGTVDHVGIYIGGGQMIDAPTTGQKVAVRSIRNPTSIRRMPGVNAPAQGGGFADAVGSVLGPAAGAGAGVLSGVGDAAGDAVSGVFGVFDGWQNSLQNIAIKVAAAGAVAGLVIVGAKTALQDRSTA